MSAAPVMKAAEAEAVGPGRDPRTIGASDIPVIFGTEQRFSSPSDIYMRLTGKVGWQRASSPDAEWGKMVEVPILDHFEKTFGCSLQRQFYIEHPEIPWAVATPDGVDPNWPIIVDAKKVDGSRWQEFEGGTLPLAMKLQGYWQIFIYNAWAEKSAKDLVESSVFYISLAGRPPQAFYLNYDAGYMKDVIFPYVQKFHANCMAGIPPETTDMLRMKSQLVKYFGIPEEGDRTVVQGTEDDLVTIKTLIKLREWQDQVKQAIGFYEAAVAQRIGSNYALEVNGYRATWAPSKGRTSTKDVLAEVVKRTKFSLSELEKIKAAHRGSPSRTLRIKAGE